jgi:hypothetical protein
VASPGNRRGAGLPPHDLHAAPHGKSFIVSEHLPAWFLTKYPELRLILASYEADFAASWGLKAKRHVEALSRTRRQVDPNTRSGARWNLKGTRGGMVTAGAGGAITGKGAHLFLIDDPIKNAEEALSATQRQSLYDWYVSTAFTRSRTWGCEACGYENGPSCEHEEDKTPGRMILMNTRWHEDDLNGRVTSRSPRSGPCSTCPPSPRRTTRWVARGEPLCPELFPLKAAGDQGRLDLVLVGIHVPGPPEHRGRRPHRPPVPLPPPHPRWTWLIDLPGTYEMTDLQGRVSYVPELSCYRFATVDVAGSVKTSADFTVFSVWDLTPQGLLLHARERIRMEQADHEERVREWYAAVPPHATSSASRTRPSGRTSSRTS